MKIRELELDDELIYPEEGVEIVRCPVCHEVWWYEREGDGEYTETPCKHLRFVYCTHEHGFVFFEGSWDHTAFESNFMEIAETEDGIDEMKAFKAISHPDVDTVVYWDYDDSPLVQWSTYWGYKADNTLGA